MTDTSDKDTRLQAPNPIDFDRLDAGDVRLATEAVVDPAKAVMEDAYAAYRADLPVPVWEHFHRSLAVAKVGNLFVHGSGSVILAGAVLGDGPVPGWPPEWAVLGALGVRESARGRGIGTRLARGCVEEAGRRGARAVGAHIAPAMTSAPALLERCGFVREPAYDLTVGRMYEVDGVSVLDRRWDLPADEKVGLAYVRRT